MAELPKDVQNLINIYKDAQGNLINTISQKEAVGTLTWYQKSLLAQVNQELQKLNVQAKDWVSRAIPENYQKGITEANTALKDVGLSIGSNAFSQLHTGAVKVLAVNTLSDLTDANMFVGRRIKDVVRQAGINAVSQKITQGQTVKQCKQQIMSRLLNEGINGIKDKRGRLIPLDVYASLVARSTTREATNRATMNQLIELGHDLVKMSSHATTCKICAIYQGRVYSISGKDNRYPKLSIAYKGPYANIHPNCRHVLMPYVEALADDAEKDREFSNRSFDIDPRSQSEIERYNQGQAQKRKLRNDKNEFEDLKLTLPETAPKSFSGFQQMKRANSERYNQLKKDYKSINISIGQKLKEPDNKVIPWPNDFPKVINHTSVANLKSIKKGNAELHSAAKKGDAEAAKELLKKVLKSDIIQELYDKTKDIQNKIITPVIALERAGHNKIPEAYSKILSNITEIPVTNMIIQINKTFHTGNNAIGRIISRAIFDGEVQKGYNYIIVDDVITLGGTLSDIRKYIISNGGNVVLASTVAQRGSLTLAINQEIINEIIKRFGRDEIEKYLTEFGIANGVEELTYSEAISILRFGQIKTLRDRTIEEKLRRNIQYD